MSSAARQRRDPPAVTDLDLGPLTVEAFIEGWYDTPAEREAAEREFKRAGLCRVIAFAPGHGGRIRR